MLDSEIIKRAGLNCRDVYGNSRPFFAFRNDEYYLDDYDDSIEITIRGSEKPTTDSGFLDWVKNLDLTQIEFYGNRIARGFSPFQLYDGIKENNGRVLKDQIGKPVRIFGHSRGGGIAKSLGVMLKHYGHAVETVVTFAAPCISKYVIPELQQIPTWEFCAYGDPVWRLPFRFWPFSWKHSGTVMRVGSYWSWRNQCQQFGILFPRTRGAIRAHLMDNYLKILRIEG